MNNYLTGVVNKECLDTVAAPAGRPDRLGPTQHFKNVLEIIEMSH